MAMLSKTIKKPALCLFFFDIPKIQFGMPSKEKDNIIWLYGKLDRWARANDAYYRDNMLIFELVPNSLEVVKGFFSDFDIKIEFYVTTPSGMCETFRNFK